VVRISIAFLICLTAFSAYSADFLPFKKSHKPRDLLLKAFIDNIPAAKTQRLFAKKKLVPQYFITIFSNLIDSGGYQNNIHYIGHYEALLSRYKKSTGYQFKTDLTSRTYVLTALTAVIIVFKIAGDRYISLETMFNIIDPYTLNLFSLDEVIKSEIEFLFKINWETDPPERLCRQESF
jgi:hypothetical protein